MAVQIERFYGGLNTATSTGATCVTYVVLQVAAGDMPTADPDRTKATTLVVKWAAIRRQWNGWFHSAVAGSTRRFLVPLDESTPLSSFASGGVTITIGSDPAQDILGYISAYNQTFEVT